MTTATCPVYTQEQFETAPLDDKTKLLHLTKYAQEMGENSRLLSSVIVSEELLEELPIDSTVRYVEVPIIEEVIKTVPVKSVIEVEKIVPKYEVKYLEKVVEVPQIHYIDRHVEKEHIQEVIHEVAGEIEVCEIPKTVVKKIPKVTYINVEKIVEVPGPVIDVSNKSPEDLLPLREIREYHDVEVPVVVAQTIRPIITQSDDYVDVDVLEYEPQIHPVDVYVATPITSKLSAVGAEEDVHNCVSIPPAQYNTILKSLNQHIPEKQCDQLPFIKTNGSVGFLSGAEAPGYVPLDSLTPPQKEMNPKSAPMGYADDSQMYVDDMSHMVTLPEKHFDDNISRQESFMRQRTMNQEKKKRLCGC